MLIFKKFLIFISVITISLLLLLSISTDFRNSVFTKSRHAYNLFKLMSLRQLIRNRDFDSAAINIEEQVSLAKLLSDDRSQLITGISESIAFATDNAMLDDELVKFRAILQDLVDMDPLWYKGRVLLARTMQHSNSNVAMVHINRAIAISGSQDEAYRAALSIFQKNGDIKSAKRYCEEYNKSQFGALTERTFNTIFYDRGISKVALIFNEKKNIKIYPNDGVQLGEFTNYEFIPMKPIATNHVSLFTSLPAGIKISFKKIKLVYDEGVHNINGNNISLTSKSSYALDYSDNLTELVTIGVDDKINIKIPSHSKLIKKIIFEIKFSKLPIASKKMCG